jgi:hypothetical protein
MNPDHRPPITFYATPEVQAFLQALPARSRSSEINRLLLKAIEAETSSSNQPAPLPPSPAEVENISPRTSVVSDDTTRLLNDLNDRLASVEEEVGYLRDKTESIPESGEGVWDRLENESVIAVLSLIEGLQEDGCFEFLKHLKKDFEAETPPK